MKLLHKSLLFLLFTIGGLSILSLVTKGIFPTISSLPFYILYSLIFLLIGRFLGLCIDLWRESDEKKGSSYNIGLTIGSIMAIGILVASVLYTDWEYNKAHDNTYENKNSIKFGYNEHYNEAMIAYNFLIKNFENENDIQLNGGSYKVVDSTINRYQERFIFFRFKYFIKEDTTLYISKIYVNQNQPHIVFLSRKAYTDKETIKRDREMGQKFKEIVPDVDELFDSVEKAMKK